MRNIFSKTTENRTQNGVKSYSFPTRLLSPILIFAFLTLGVGQMWGAVTLYYQKDMPANNYSASNSATMTQSSVNSDRYYCTLNLTASSSYGFYIKWDNNYYKVSATAQNYTDVLLYDYGSTNYGNSPHRVTYTTPSSGGNTIFIFDTSNKKICVSPTSSQTIKISYATASGKDSYYDLGNYTDLSQDGSSANYYVDLDLTAVKYYMFMQLKVGSSTYSYWRGTSTLTEGNSVSLYDYGTSNYGNSSDKVNFTPSAAGKYRFTWNQLDKTVKLQRVYKVTYDGNGSTSGTTPDDAYYPNGATVMVASNSGSLAKTGYTFDGWNTANDGSGTSYDAGANITVTDSDVKLYAQWAQQSLTITDYPKYLSQTEKLNLTISYENIPEGYCFRVHELRTNGYYNNEAQGAYNPISGTGSTTYTSSAYLPTGDVDRIVVELWKIYPFEKQSVVSNEVAVTVEQEWRVDVKAKTDGLISTVGGTVSPASVSPTAHKGQTITAEANVGYKFTGWTANTPNITFENASEPSTTVYATASGEVYANYVRYVNIFLPNTGNNWDPSDVNWKFDKRPGDVGNTVTLAVDINKSDYESSNYKLGFNIFHADWEYKWWHNKHDGDSYMDAHNCTDWGFNTTVGDHKTYLDLNVSGTYTFTLTNSDNSGLQKLSVTYPDKSFIEGDFPTAWSEDAYTLTENGDIQSVRINITTKGDKQFRLVSHGKLFGTSTKITAAANSQTLSAKKMTDEGAVMTLDAYVTGAYTFTYNKSSQNLTVTFPTAYTVTYGVGTGYTSMGGVSTTPNITSGDYVIEGREITFTATPNLGYKFVGWYNNEACTGGAISTNATYNIASLSADTYLYAKFDYRPLYIHADFAPNGWDTPVQMTQSTENRAVYTYEIDPLAAKSGTPASEGHHFHFVNTVENPNDHKAYNYKGVQTPKGSGFLTNENIHLTDEKNATIQFDLMRKSKITITLTLQSIDDDPKPTVHIAADPYYTVHTATGGSGAAGITINPTSVEARSGANSGEIIATIAPGYTFVNWTPDNSNITINSPNDPTTTVRATGDGTLTANATANSYTVHFEGNGNTGGSMSDLPTRTYGVAFNLTANAFTKTGYTFAGWATEADGKVRYADEAEVSNLTTENNGRATLYAKWTPNQYTVTLDKQTSAEGYGGNAGSVTDQTVTFDATLATVSGSMSMPTAKDGWAFMGFYSAKDGSGRQFINPSGEWVANAGDTIRDSKWVYDGNVTLYAYYKKAEITDLIFDAAVVAPSASVGVTPKVDPTPAGTNSICWKLLYNNGNLYTPQPNFENPRGIANKVTFTAPNTSGMYLVAAVLRTGSSCDGGTKLDSVTYPFQVAGDHTVTVQYKCGDVTLQGSTSVSARPLDWSEDITAPTITGYTFTRWEAGDGITIKDGETNTNPTHIKAIYDGKLTAIYSKKNMIYFNNTLGWSDVWVYFYTSNKYWDDNYGTGAYKGKKFDAKSPFWDMHYGQMTQIEGTDIWYFDYTALGWDGWANVAFANMNKANAGEDNTSNDDLGFFSNTTEDPIQVVRRGEYKTSLPMFVPLAGVEPVKLNNKKAEYYNEGYWMNYPENTGYTLHIYRGTTKEVQDEIRSIAFPFTADKTMPMEVTLELNANTTYGYEIHRADGAYYANNSTIKINASSDIKLSDTQRGGIKTSAAGDYVFKLNFGNSDGYGYLFSVQYPVAVGSYRIVYTESGETLWSGHPKPAGWHHPSRSIEKKDGAKDIVSFYVSKAGGANASMKFQYASAVDGEGNVTWTDVTGAGGTIDLSSITQSGVYNFHLTQTNGSISVDKVEPYTGNYYIRTDNAGSTKWDNYRAADHQMTYSEFSKDRATNTFGELYTHYYMHWCPRGTNVKFCIANDYSSCITDTLVNDVVSLGNMADAGWLNRDNASEVYRDKFSANIRFMYDERTNKISRAYMSSSTNTDRKFLVLKSNTEFWNSDGSVLNGSGESAVAGNYEAIFKDNEDWIYEREIKLTPGQKFKLYASYAQETAQENGSQHFCGNYADNDWENAENYVALVGGTGAPCNVRIIYDFKTNRLLAAMVPSGEISTEMEIYADVMFIREHQGDIEQLIFNGSGKITNIKTAYAVMRFNKWTLNNKEKTGSHNPLASPASIYERAMYFISFPFEVKLSEVFGFGTYGQDWIIEYYDGAERARTGWWEGQPGFWRYVWDRKNFVLKPNVGYLLELELGNFKEGSGFWNNKNERLELFFPSSGPLGSIMNSTVNCTIPEHTCYINRHETEGLPETSDPSTSYNRTVFDSHWNIMSVPTYVNVDDPSFANTTWIGGENGNVGPKFLYTWNMDDNTLTATSGKGFMYHAMHAYTVQYYGDVTWTTSVTPPAAPQRNTEYRGEYEFCLEVQQDEQMIDRTYVRLSDDENVTTGFEFSEDMTKQFNSRKANIFTIAGNTSLGGNSLPLSTTQTTVVPVGVKIKTAGDYTFSIPEGTDGIGVTLVDNETGVRTLLSALDYTVNLTAGTHDGRFVLEISPIQNTPTGIEEPTSDSSLKGRAQKRIIDGVLYIVKDGKIFDARGTRVE